MLEHFFGLQRCNTAEGCVIDVFEHESEITSCRCHPIDKQHSFPNGEVHNESATIPEIDASLNEADEPSRQAARYTQTMKVQETKDPLSYIAGRQADERIVKEYSVFAETTDKSTAYSHSAEHVNMEMTEGSSLTENPERLPMGLATPVKTLHPSDFIVDLALKDGEKTRLGLDIFFAHPKYLKILKVHSGLIKDWNLLHPDTQVEAGDYFIEVNGCSGSPFKLMEQIAQGNKWRITVRKAGTSEL